MTKILNKQFKPDNFSDPRIFYRALNRQEYADFLPLLDAYYDQYQIKYIGELRGTEINSNNFKIILKVNKQTETILLRRFKVLTAPQQILTYLSLLKKLKVSDVPVVDIKLNSDQKLVTFKNNNYYAIFNFIAGEHFRPTNRSFTSLAKSIGLMHRALKKIPWRDRKKINYFSGRTKNIYYNQIKKYRAADFKICLEIIKNKKSKTTVDKILLAELPPLIAQVRISKRALIKNLPQQIIHSDLHPHNVLFKGQAAAAIIDFDCMRLSPVARDVAIATYRFGRQFLVGQKMSETNLRKKAKKLQDQFLTAYQRINPLTPQEIKALPLLIKDEFLTKLLFVLRGAYLEGNISWTQDTIKFIDALKEINYFWD